MGNFFDIDYEQEYLADFHDDILEKTSEIEQFSIKLDDSNGSDPTLVSLIGAVNTLKNNANETQIIPLASALDSLENILSLFAQKEFHLPLNFSKFIGAIFEVANEMADQAAQMQKVDFDLFSKIQNSLQPLGQCTSEDIEDTISLAVSLLSNTEDSSEVGAEIDLFGDDSVGEVELFDEPESSNKNESNIDGTVYITSDGSKFFAPSYSKRSIEDLQAFRLFADEAASASKEKYNNSDKIALTLNLVRFLNAAAKNLVDASQLEAAVYMNEVRPQCPNKCSPAMSKMVTIPGAIGWELASSIVAFQNIKKPEFSATDKSLGSQILNGAQILGIALAFVEQTKCSNDADIILKAKRDIAHMTDRFSIFWLKIFLRLADKVIEYTNKTSKSHSTKRVSSKTILCVDDDEITLMVFEHMLKKAGHTPLTIDNYEDAVKVINISPPDLILLDLNMPGKGGYWLIEEKKNNELFNNIPIAIISGSKEDYDIDTSQVIGVYEKPVSKETMLEIISKACG